MPILESLLPYLQDLVGCTSQIAWKIEGLAISAILWNFDSEHGL